MARELRLGVTLGDPTGIGPELVVRALAAAAPSSPAAADRVQWIVFGDRGVLERAALLTGVALSARLLAHLVEVTRLPVLVPGRPCLEAGAAQVAYLERAVEAARQGALDGLVTAPIHKASCIEAGFGFPGHTEFLAARLGAPRVTMMLAGPRLRVSLATTHLPLAAVPGALSIEKIAGAVVDTAWALRRDFGLVAPRVAVAALNPHAGESGHFGDEEARLVAPAIARARAEASFASISGPHVPDAVFRAARLDLEARHDAVVALYHDQGLIPVKVIDFDEAVNLTLGLPLVRTSPDHGVAHDLAGTGRARTTSFQAALQLAREIASRRVAAAPASP